MGKVKKTPKLKAGKPDPLLDEVLREELNGDTTTQKKLESKIKTKKQKTAAADGVTQFDPNLNLSSLFSSNSTSTGKVSKIVTQGKPAFPPIKKVIDKGAKKGGKLKNKDAKAKVQTASTEPQPKSTKDQKTSSVKVKKSKKAKLVNNSNKVDLEEPKPDAAAPEDDGPTKKESDEKAQKSFQELNQPKLKNEELEHRTVFIGNVPKELVKDVRHKTIKKLFKPFGEIETIRYRSVTSAKPTMLKKVAAYRNEVHPNRSNVSAYVRFSTRDEAEAAAKHVNGTKLLDHHLTVDLADNSGTKKDNKKAIFIGNLQLNTQDDDLWTFFEDCGAISSVRIVRDQASGLGKGFGYVNFQDAASIELALTKNEEVLNGRPLRVSRVVKKLKKKKVSGDESTQGTRRKGKPRNIQQGNFSGDQTAEIGKIKRNAKKVNKGDLKKACIAKQLMGDSQVGRGKNKKPANLPRKFNKNSSTEKAKKSKSSSARQAHSRERSAKFKKQKPSEKPVKQKTQFKRYFSK